jgi:hypothetical protein
LTFWFLAFLAIAWLVVYLPSVWRARAHTPLNAVENFKRRMRLISPRASGGRWVVVPESGRHLVRSERRESSVRLKRVVLLILLTLTLATGLWALIRWDGNLLELHLVVVGATGFYAALLIDAKRRRDERLVKVASLTERARPSLEEHHERLEAGAHHH